MKESHLLSHHIRLLNDCLLQKLLKNEEKALYRSEQGKILSVLWESETGCATATDISLATGLANNTLTTMIKNLAEIGLVTIQPCSKDRRKKYVVLTDLGWSQQEIGQRVSQELDQIYFKGFSKEDIAKLESYQKRILANLKAYDE